MESYTPEVWWHFLDNMKRQRDDWNGDDTETKNNVAFRWITPRSPVTYAYYNIILLNCGVFTLFS